MNVISFKMSDPREQDVQPYPACAGCGEQTDLHYDTSGLFWIGCAGALRRRALGLVNGERLVVTRHPEVSQAVRGALLTSCGVMSSVYTDLTLSQQIEMANLLAAVAVRAGKDVA